MGVGSSNIGGRRCDWVLGWRGPLGDLDIVIWGEEKVGGKEVLNVKIPGSGW